ncbi:MAG: hypothetical protein ABSF91_13880 [Bacteroidota bacterium]|jgi:hypothetical protein
MITRNPILRNGPLPVEIVFHPSWWYRHAGVVFDEDFFYHPVRRVEAERTMEKVLYERFGDLGLGEDRDKNLPMIGAVHNAAGYLVSEMLGCKVKYEEGGPPAVIPAQHQDLSIDVDSAFSGSPFRRLRNLIETLKRTYGYVVGDVNWAGLLNLALDLRGQDIFIDFFDRPTEVSLFLSRIADSIERFTSAISHETGTTSISVNRTVRHIQGPVFLHSECSVTMVSAAHYEKFILPFDQVWSTRHRPFGIHFCGPDPHRFAEVWTRIPHLDFLDVGWGGDMRILRARLPQTFLNIRLSPVETVAMSPEDIRREITLRVKDSENLYLTGVCCINMDDRVTDEKIRAIFKTVFDLRGAAV